MFATIRTVKEIAREIRELRKEMRENGIRVTSCFNGGLSGAEYAANARLFALTTEKKDAEKRAMVSA